MLWSALAESNGALVIGYLAAVAVGVPLGLKMGRSRIVDGLAQGYLSILLIAPVAMIIPIIIMALGFGVIPRSIIIFIFVIPMVVVNSRAGVRTVPPDIIEMGRTFGATERQLWRYVILPAAAPAVFTGLRIGIGRAVTGMVIAEWLLAAVGIGALLLQFRGGFQADALFAVIIVVLAESLVLVQLLRVVERRVVGWAMP
jgi:NitT/TauT family transport system permease protein